jgi:hypothetical protein
MNRGIRRKLVERFESSLLFAMNERRGIKTVVGTRIRSLPHHSRLPPLLSRASHCSFFIYSKNPIVLLFQYRMHIFNPARALFFLLPILSPLLATAQRTPCQTQTCESHGPVQAGRVVRLTAPDWYETTVTFTFGRIVRTGGVAVRIDNNIPAELTVSKLMSKALDEVS